MTKQKRSDDWGFPRWRSYGAKGRDATQVRICDRDGCTAPGDRPAPKAPNNPDRWYFCENHAAEYNKGWNYFEGLAEAEADARARTESAGANAYRSSAHWSWGGEGDGSRSRDEMRALGMLELDMNATMVEVKAAHRRLAKANHPDLKPGDAAAADAFQKIQASYEVLRKADERRVAVAAATTTPDR